MRVSLVFATVLLCACVAQAADLEVPKGVWRELAAFGRDKDCVKPLVIADPEARPLIRRGLTDLQNTPPERDAWEIVYDGGCAYLLGTNPRSVMQTGSASCSRRS